MFPVKVNIFIFSLSVHVNLHLQVSLWVFISQIFGWHTCQFKIKVPLPPGLSPKPLNAEAEQIWQLAWGYEGGGPVVRIEGLMRVVDTAISIKWCWISLIDRFNHHKLIEKSMYFRHFYVLNSTGGKWGISDKLFLEQRVGRRAQNVRNVVSWRGSPNDDIISFQF